MAGERRALTAGLTVVPPGADPEAVKAFISQDSAVDKPAIAASQNASTSPSPSQSELTVDPKLSRNKPVRKGTVPVGLIPVTVRLSPEIAGALKRLSLERQLAGIEPRTQQEIVEQALQPLLTAEGLL